MSGHKKKLRKRDVEKLENTSVAGALPPSEIDGCPSWPDCDPMPTHDGLCGPIGEVG